MIDLGLRRRRPSDRHRASTTRWVARLETLESRIALNGAVGVPAQFVGFSPHPYQITSIPQDPENDGIIPSPTVTFNGQFGLPGTIPGFHGMTLTILAFSGGNTPTTPGASPIGTQAIPITSSSVAPLPFSFSADVQSNVPVTFWINAAGQNAQVTRVDNGQPLQATFVIQSTPTGPTITTISSISSPRTMPVSSVDVTFSEEINPATFTTDDLNLTRDTGSGPVNVPLGAEVTFTSSDNITFTIGGLASSTTDPGSYSFTVDASNIADPGGTNGMGSESVDFIVESADAPPRVSEIGPITSPRTTPVSTFDVTFSKPIDPTTFTTADLALSRDNTPVPLGQDVTFSTLDNVTFTVGGLEQETAAVGNYFLRVSAAGVTDTNGVPGEGSLTTTFTVEPVVIDTGPRVVGLVRFGVHRAPSSLMLSFDRPLDPATAVMRSNYAVYGPGRDGRIGTRDDRRVPLSSGIYNSANRTVTLVMARPLVLSKQYRIVVRGTAPDGVRDTNGVLLDGQSNGMPGTDFSTVFGREILAIVAPGTDPSPTRTSGVKVNGKGRFRHFNLGG